MAKILVVDDRAENRQFLVKLLRYFGHQVCEAVDGADALKRSRGERPDLIVTDLLMPNVDGFEFVRQLRADATLAPTPVLFYTATYLLSQVQDLARQLGVRRVLDKPSKPAVILQAVNDALAAGPGPPVTVPEHFEIEHQQLLTGQFARKLDAVSTRLEAIVQHNLELSIQTDPLQLLQNSCHSAREIIGARCALVGVTLSRGSEGRVVVTSGVAADTSEHLAAVLSQLAPFEQLLPAERTARFQAGPAHPAVPAELPPFAAYLAARIASPTRVYGWLCLLDKLGEKEFTEEDERLAAMLAAQLGSSYENGSLFNEVRQQAIALEMELNERVRAQQLLTRRARLAEMTAAVAQALTQAATLPEMLQHCAEELARGHDEAAARIWTFDAAARVLDLQASAGAFTHANESLDHVPLGAGRIGRIAEQKQPYMTNSASSDDLGGDRDWPLREGIVALAGYPLLGQDRLAGVLALFKRRPLVDDSLNALTGVANQLALGIERKSAEALLQENQARMTALVESAMDAIITVDSDQRIVQFNGAAEQMFGVPAADALGRALDCFIPERFRPAHRGHVDRFGSTGQTGRRMGALSAVTGLRATGEEFPVEASISCTTVGGTKIFTAIVRDVSERERLEQQLRQAQKMEAIGQLAGGIAHDFNNLLTVINGYSELLLVKLRGPDTLRAPDALRNPLEQMHRAGARAATLTRQLLAFSRKQVLTPVVLNFNDILADVEKMLHQLINESIALRITGAADLGQVKADPGQIEQVLLNLVVNARDAMPLGGKLTIETANVELDQAYVTRHPYVQAGQFIMLAVTDTGCGMDKATQARIFEPFFSTKGEKGTGLGLATVYGIVKQSGGTLEVYSEPGLGSTFKVYMPRVSQSKEALPSRIVKPPARGTETVLVVEDEEGVRTFTRAILEAYGYQVLEADNGGAALLLAEKYVHDIHLLLTDVVMPGISGPELARCLGALRPKMKVLFLSGYTDDAIVRHGVLEPGVAFLHKPFRPEALAQKIREVLQPVPTN